MVVLAAGQQGELPAPAANCLISVFAGEVGEVWATFHPVSQVSSIIPANPICAIQWPHAPINRGEITNSSKVR